MPQPAGVVARLMARGPVGRASNGCPERRLVRWLLLGTHGLVLRARNHERRMDGDGRRTDRDREDAAVAASRDLRNDRHPPCAGRAFVCDSQRPSRSHDSGERDDVSNESDEPLAVGRSDYASRGKARVPVAPALDTPSVNAASRARRRLGTSARAAVVPDVGRLASGELVRFTLDAPHGRGVPSGASRSSSSRTQPKGRSGVMSARGKIAVAGATGRVGRHVVELLEERGHDVVGISRSLGVDVVTGEGLAEALAGVETVVDAATGPSPEEGPATEFFTASARNLQTLGERAGVQGIVVVSIIGVDRFTSGYQAAKHAQERMLLAGPIPVRILRAAQFHEFVPQLVNWGRQNGVSYLPKMRTQLVAARTVAEALADLATLPDSDPAGTNGAPIPEIAGPRPESLDEMARLLAAHRRDPVRIESVGDTAVGEGELLANGALLPGPHATLAGPTFEEWLEGEPAN